MDNQKSESESEISTAMLSRKIQVLIAILATAVIVLVIATTILVSLNMWTSPLGASFHMLLMAVISCILLMGLATFYTHANRSEKTGYHLEKILNAIEQQNLYLQWIARDGQLSDRLKELVYRSANISTLQNAVTESLANSHFQIANDIVNRARELGMKKETIASLENAIAESKKASMEEQTQVYSRKVETLIDQHQWAEAKQICDNCIAEYGNSPKISALKDRIQSARASYKAKLLKMYGEAVKIDNVDRSIELLRELDSYLTHQEGEALAESARDVFKKRLHQLGVQFSIAAADDEWDLAIETGEEIMREFPNSRMSKEVHEKMPLLVNRAATHDGQQPLVSNETSTPAQTGAAEQPAPLSTSIPLQDIDSPGEPAPGAEPEKSQQAQPAQEAASAPVSEPEKSQQGQPAQEAAPAPVSEPEKNQPAQPQVSPDAETENKEKAD